MDYNQGKELHKYQWDLVKDPQGEAFAIFMDEEEVAMLDQRMSKESISDLLEDIHNANEDGENQLDLSTFEMSKGSCPDIELGEYNIDFISLNVGAGIQIDPENNPLKRDPLVIDPSEMNREECEAPEGYEGDFTKYSFHRLDESLMNEGEYVESDSIELEVIVKEADKEKLRAYLYDQGLLKPGDPLIDMKIVGTNSDNHEDRIGGMFGCSRSSLNNCDNTSIPGLHKYSGKIQVHGGIDLGADLKTKIFSMYEGTVIIANDNTQQGHLGNHLLGNRVLIKSSPEQHDENNNTIYIYYTHLSSVSEDIEQGDTIKQGEMIGRTGCTGNAYGIDAWRYHTHLIIYENGTENSDKVDPRGYLNTKFDINGNKIE
jgi:hypothetical protein